MSDTARESQENVGFDAHKFLVDKFGGSRYVLTLVGAYGLGFPEHEAVLKWFSRGRIPGDWLPILLGVLELEEGRAVSLLPYIRGVA